MRRKFAISLITLLVVSLTANVALLGWLKSQKQRANMLDLELQHAGKKWGSRQAEYDFRAGAPAYYTFGGFTAGNRPMRADKPGRVVISMGCLVFPFDEVFVKNYNQHMDTLFAARSKPQISKP